MNRSAPCRGAVSARDVANRLSCSRRDFLRTTAGVTLGSALMGASPFLWAESARRKRKVIVITFGGGARDQETFAPEGQENIPHLLQELIPQSSFLPRSLTTGFWGTTWRRRVWQLESTKH